jgi:hypothetical protein
MTDFNEANQAVLRLASLNNSLSLETLLRAARFDYDMHFMFMMSKASQIECRDTLQAIADHLKYLIELQYPVVEPNITALIDMAGHCWYEISRLVDHANHYINK